MALFLPNKIVFSLVIYVQTKISVRTTHFRCGCLMCRYVTFDLTRLLILHTIHCRRVSCTAGTVVDVETIIILGEAFTK